MAKGRNVRPTEGELEVLRVLWQRGPSTVRQVHEALRPDGQTSYNTTLKFLQIMHDKGLVVRDPSLRPQVYRPSVPENQMQGRLLSDFLERVFGGSARRLVAALAASDIPPEELAQIRRLLDALEEEP